MFVWFLWFVWFIWFDVRSHQPPRLACPASLAHEIDQTDHPPRLAIPARPTSLAYEIDRTNRLRPVG